MSDHGTIWVRNWVESETRCSACERTSADVVSSLLDIPIDGDMQMSNSISDLHIPPPRPQYDAGASSDPCSRAGYRRLAGASRPHGAIQPCSASRRSIDGPDDFLAFLTRSPRIFRPRLVSEPCRPLRPLAALGRTLRHTDNGQISPKGRLSPGRNERCSCPIRECPLASRRARHRCPARCPGAQTNPL